MKRGCSFLFICIFVTALSLVIQQAYRSLIVPELDFVQTDEDLYTQVESAVLPANLRDVEDSRKFRFTILHTHDLHSSVEGSSPDHIDYVNSPEKRGHYARLAHLIRDVKHKKLQLDEPVLLLDSGDWFVGSLFSLLSKYHHLLEEVDNTTLLPELDFFRHCGYDAITFGNHEFDLPTSELAQMIKKGGKGLSFVSSNLVVEGEINKEFKALFSNEGKTVAAERTPQDLNSEARIYPYIIKELRNKNRNLKVGIIGMYGTSSSFLSSYSRQEITAVGFDDNKMQVMWEDYVQHTKRAVAELNEKQVDLVVVLGHSGYPEDFDLARDVPGIAVHLSSHSHAKYFIKEGNTIISQTGSLGNNLGVLELEFVADEKNSGLLYLRNDDNTMFRVQNPFFNDVTNNHKMLPNVHVPINRDIPLDDVFTKLIQSYRSGINKFVLPQILGVKYNYESIVANLTQSFTRVTGTLPTMLTNGVLQVLNQMELFSSPDLVPASKVGQIQSFMYAHPHMRVDLDAIQEGTIYQYSDIFKMMHVGFDINGEPSHPVAVFYLTKQEVGLFIETLELYKVLNPTMAMYFGGINFDTNSWWRSIPLVNRITNITINGKLYDEWPELVSFSVNSSVLRYLFGIPQTSFGLVPLYMRNAQGEQIRVKADLDTLNIYTPTLVNNRRTAKPLKEFNLLSDFLHLEHN